MGSTHQVSSDGYGNRGLAELNHHMQDDCKEAAKYIMREGQRPSDNDESKINEAAENVNNVTGDAATSLAHQIGLQKQHQPIVRWERFLPVRILKVLLVENDDSTRQVVSALLRNCSYEVTAAANGLQAWKILEDLTTHVDLVLTEVFVPCLSGIGLLYKIMNHKACKNIPVIMMSSNDSMGTVFKCLSKGAVDFLVKPIRKNELKNLWQHVWRRCHSSSGSGSESGIQIQRSAESKSADDSDNNTGSNDEDISGSIGLNARDGSDNGSGTQNSWTKRAVEVDSPQPLFPSDQLADPHDNICVHAIHPKIGTFCNEWLPMTAKGEIRKQKETTDDIMGKDLEIGVPRSSGTQHELCPTEAFTKRNSESMDKDFEIRNVSDKPSMEAVDLLGAIANCTDAHPITRDTESYNRCSRLSDTAIDSPMDCPSLDLSLKRPRSTGEGGTATHNDRNVLRRSNLSAFSRYHTSVASTQSPTGYGGSCSPPDNRSEAVKTESTRNVTSDSSAAPTDMGSTTKNMGSTTKNVFAKPAAFKEKMVSESPVKQGHTSAFHPVLLRTSAAPQVMQEKNYDMEVDAIGGQPMGIQHQVQVQHDHHHYHHHHRLHIRNMQRLLDHDDSSRKTMAADAPYCGSSNVLAEPTEGDVANYSLDGSKSVSNHGSNGQKGSSAAVNAGGINMESGNGILESSGTGGSNGSGVDQDRFAQREAALNKFRQKRKERNFQKKVRYQSRQRLAEQRPRVRGQFVRQNIHEDTSREADS